MGCLSGKHGTQDNKNTTKYVYIYKRDYERTLYFYTFHSFGINIHVANAVDT